MNAAHPAAARRRSHRRRRASAACATTSRRRCGCCSAIAGGGAAHRLRQPRESAARRADSARRTRPRSASRSAPRAGGSRAIRRREPGAVARRSARPRLLVAYAGARAIVSLTFHGATTVPIEASPSPRVLAFAIAAVARHRRPVRHGAGVARLTIGSDRRDARRRARRGSGVRALRRVLLTLQVATVARAHRLRRPARAQPRESPIAGFRIPRRRAASRVVRAVALDDSGRIAAPAIYAAHAGTPGPCPGRAHVAFSLYSPMSGDNWSSLITVDGHDPTERLQASWNRVSPHYFETTGTPMLRGRAIDERDRSRLAAGRRRQPDVRAHVLRQRRSDRPASRIRQPWRRRRSPFEIVGIVARREVSGPAGRRLRDVLPAVPAGAAPGGWRSADWAGLITRRRSRSRRRRRRRHSRRVRRVNCAASIAAWRSPRPDHGGAGRQGTSTVTA